MKAACASWIRFLLVVLIGMFGAPAGLGDPLSAQAAVPPAAAPGWISTLVGAGSLPAMELDSAGLVHAVYSSAAQNALLYTHQLPGGAWASETAVPDLVEGLAAPPALALGADAKVHLVYLTASGQAGYALWSCTLGVCTWQSEEIPAQDVRTCGRLSLMLDAAGRPHTLLCQGSQLIEYTRGSTTWSTQLVADMPSGFVTQVVLDKDRMGSLGAAFSASDGSLNWAHKLYNQPVWVPDPLLTGGLQAPALRFDQTTPLIAYYDSQDHSISLKSKPSNWMDAKILVDDPDLPDSIAGLSMQLRQSRTHLAFSGAGGGGLWYGFENEAGEWVSQPPPFSGRWPVLRLDAAGRACILFESLVGNITLTCQGYLHYLPAVFR